MRLTTKGRYAVTAMLDLAIHREQGPISLADISQRQGISLSYLEQLFGRRRKGMLVKSVRGPGGGYELDRTPDCIKISHIIDVVNEDDYGVWVKGLPEVATVITVGQELVVNGEVVDVVLTDPLDTPSAERTSIGAL